MKTLIAVLLIGSLTVAQAGYRYLYVNYRSGGVIFDAATSGLMFGVSVNLK